MENWMRLDVAPAEKINPSFKGLSGQESQLPPTFLIPRPRPTEEGQAWDSEELLALPVQGRPEVGEPAWVCLTHYWVYKADPGFPGQPLRVLHDPFVTFSLLFHLFKNYRAFS